MNRKSLIAIAILVILLGVGGYFYFQKRVPAAAPTAEFPGGSKSSTGTSGGTQGGTLPEGETFTPGSKSAIPRLYELHKAPVAGAGFMETKDKKGAITNISARYLERGVGNIFESDLSTYTESRIVNETRPRIAEALWGNSGKSVIVRFADDKENGVIKTRIINISTSAASFAKGTSAENTSTGFLKTEELYLPDYIPFVATSEDGADKLFYLEGGIGSIATFKDTSVSKILSSAFAEWLPQFPSQKLITLTTRPSAKVPGHLFFLNPATNSVTKIIGGINGLTTLTSHDGKLVLYSETRGGAPELSLYDTAKNESHLLPIQSLPEKCVWGTKKATLVYCAIPQTLQSATYPDQWYQGLVSFSDALWEIDTATFNARKIMAPSELGAPALDMTNLALSSDDAYLLFMNKISGTPWVYRISEPLPPITTTASPVSTTTKAVVPPSIITSGMQKLK